MTDLGTKSADLTKLALGRFGDTVGRFGGKVGGFGEQLVGFEDTLCGLEPDSQQ